MRFLNTIKYYLLKKYTSSVWKPYLTIQNVKFSELFEEKTQDPYDLSGRQIYTKGPNKNGKFSCIRLSDREKKSYLKDFKKNYSDRGTPKYEWIYKSNACNSFNTFRIDINTPGKMRVRCTLPKYSWAAVWLFSSQNESDFNKDMPVIDRHEYPMNYYWEVDLFETMMDPQRIVFSGHYGTQQHRELKNDSIFWKDDGKFHEVEVKWDGTGWWSWSLDDVLMYFTYIPQPEKKIYPYLLCTLGMWDDYPDIDYPINFEIEWIKFSDNLLFLSHK